MLKYASGEEEGKRTVVGNTPSPKDAYKEEMSPLIAASYYRSDSCL